MFISTLFSHFPYLLHVPLPNIHMHTFKIPSQSTQGQSCFSCQPWSLRCHTVPWWNVRAIPSSLKWNRLYGLWSHMQPLWIPAHRILWASFSISWAYNSLVTTQLRHPFSNSYFWTHPFFLRPNISSHHCLLTAFFLPNVISQVFITRNQHRMLASTRGTESCVPLGHSLRCFKPQFVIWKWWH